MAKSKSTSLFSVLSYTSKRNFLDRLRGIGCHELQHLLLQLRIHLVRVGHNMRKQRAEFQMLHVFVQHRKNADLQ